MLHIYFNQEKLHSIIKSDKQHTPLHKTEKNYFERYFSKELYLSDNFSISIVQCVNDCKIYKLLLTSLINKNFCRPPQQY